MGAQRRRVFISEPIPASALGHLRTVAEVEVGEDSGWLMPRAELLERVRPPEIFGKNVPLHCGPGRPSHLLLPIVPSKR